VDPERPDRGAQVYRWNPGMEQPARISDLDGGVANLKVSPTEQHIAYTARIKMDATVQDLYADLPKADARIIDALMFRHWDAWRDFKYSHLHVAPLSTEEGVGQSRDLMAGLRADCPVPPFGGASQFDWSPDGLELAYTTKIDENMAQSTNSDIYLIDVQGLNPPRNITAGQMGYDNDPKYSPDGRFIAYHSMERPGFEADRNRIMLYDRAAQKSSDLTAGLDQNADHARWLPDASGLVFESDYRGCLQLFAIRLAGRAVTQLTRDPANHALADVTPDGRSVLVAKNDMIQPADWFLLDLEAGGQRRLSDVNRPLLESLELPTFEERWVPATDGKSIHCWVIYPPGFDPQSGQKYPLLTFCQGGPQGQVSQFFSYRWNFHLMAAQGYIVLAPNRRGLPGFGRAWNDQISGDWGGQAMQDLLSATDALRREPYVDAQRVGAVGASFGGYTVYWLMGNAGDRFAAMISHCGVFNLESMYASTEELFFVDWDLGGPYWRSPEARQKYEQFSPNRYIQNWKTPLLVIHGEKDFRVPINQGLEAFTTAQLQGVPSRFLYFPNEGHWVMQPQNGVLWHRVFFEWLDQYLKP
jgi:dipeptidyl aminopeptidase/acylaminoacyl peptidase